MPSLGGLILFLGDIFLEAIVTILVVVVTVEINTIFIEIVDPLHTNRTLARSEFHYPPPLQIGHGSTPVYFLA